MENTPKQMTLLEFEAAMDARLRHASLVRARARMDEPIEPMELSRRTSMEPATQEEPPEAVTNTEKATAGPSISQQIMDFITAAEKPVSSNEISRSLDGVTPGYVSQLLSQLLRAGKVTHEKGLWAAV